MVITPSSNVLSPATEALRDGDDVHARFLGRSAAAPDWGAFFGERAGAFAGVF